MHDVCRSLTQGWNEQHKVVCNIGDHIIKVIAIQDTNKHKVKGGHIPDKLQKSNFKKVIALEFNILKLWKVYLD